MSYRFALPEAVRLRMDQLWIDAEKTRSASKLVIDTCPTLDDATDEAVIASYERRQRQLAVSLVSYPASCKD